MQSFVWWHKLFLPIQPLVVFFNTLFYKTSIVIMVFTPQVPVFFGLAGVILEILCRNFVIVVNFYPANFNKSVNFIRINRQNFYLSNQSFRIWWLISSMEVTKKMQYFSSISLKSCLLGKNPGTWGVNTTLVDFGGVL